MRGGPETPLSKGSADIPLEQAVSPADLLNTPLQDQTIGLGPDMGRTSQNMMDDGRGEYSTTTTGAPPPIPEQDLLGGQSSPSGPAGPTPPAGSVVGQEEQPQSDQRNRGGGIKSDLRYNEAELNPNYRYSQRDFYPDRPQFVTTDAVGERMQLASAGEIPYGVLASRKQVLQSKRELLNQKKTDLLGHDYGNTAPQYQQEYAKYASESQQKLISDVANSFDGDRSAALEYLTNTQEGQRQWAEHNRNVQAVGTEVKDMVEVAEDRLINHGKGLISLNEEELKYAKDLVGGYRSLGTDKEVDLNELIKNSRYLNQYMGRDKYMKEYGTDFVKNFAQTTKGIDPENPPYWSQGKLFIPVTERTTYDGLIENMSRSMTQMNMFKDVNEAKDWLQNMMPPDVKTDVKVVGPNKTSGSSESGSGDGGGGPMVRTSVTRLVSGSGDKDSDVTRVPTFTPVQITGKKEHKVKVMNLQINNGQVDLYAPSLKYNRYHKKNESGWYIEGQSLSQSEVKNLLSTTEGENFPNDVETVTDKETEGTLSKKRTMSRARIEDNADAMETYFGTRDPYQLVVDQLSTKFDGVTIEKVKTAFEAGGSAYDKILNELQ